MFHDAALIWPFRLEVLNWIARYAGLGYPLVILDGLCLNSRILRLSTWRFLG